MAHPHPQHTASEKTFVLRDDDGDELSVERVGASYLLHVSPDGVALSADAAAALSRWLAEPPF